MGNYIGNTAYISADYCHCQFCDGVVAFVPSHTTFEAKHVITETTYIQQSTRRES